MLSTQNLLLKINVEAKKSTGIFKKIYLLLLIFRKKKSSGLILFFDKSSVYIRQVCKIALLK